MPQYAVGQPADPREPESSNDPLPLDRRIYMTALTAEARHGNRVGLGAGQVSRH
jgi:hypothetical protein